MFWLLEEILIPVETGFEILWTRGIPSDFAQASRLQREKKRNRLAMSASGKTRECSWSVIGSAKPPRIVNTLRTDPTVFQVWPKVDALARVLVAVV